MKKLIISFLTLAAVSFSAKAQLYVGGLVGLDLTAPKSSTVFTFQASPEVGYNFSDKFAAGASLNLVPSVTSFDGESSGTFAWNIQPYVRFKFANIGKLKLFGDVAVGLGTVGTSLRHEDITVKSKAAFQWSVGLRPGISYDFTQHWSLVTHIAGISYGGTKNNNAFNLNIFSSASIGVYYNF